MSFLAELRRRRVFRVAFAYAAGAFVAAQAAQIYFPALGLPDWTVRAVVVLSLVGLPVALILAWVFDIQRTPALDELQEAQARTGVLAADATVPVGAGVVAITARRIAAVGAVAVLALTGLALLTLRERAEPLDRQRVLVMAFENLAGDAALDPVGRMAAEWLTQGLAATGLVEVVPAMTVLAAAPTNATGGELERALAIGRERRAGTIVWGAYYATGGQLTFSAQISDVATGRLLVALEPVATPVDDPAAALAELRERTMSALGTILNPRLAGLAAGTSQPWSWAAYQEYADGMERYVRGDFPGAAERFQRAFQADTTLLSAALWYANSLTNNVDLHAADSVAAWLEERRQHLTSYERAFLERLRARMRSDWITAHRAAVRMVELAPGSDDAMREAALDALRLNRAAEAVDRLRSLDPDGGWVRGWHQYWFFLAAGYHMLGRHDEELRAVHEGARRDAGSFPWPLLESAALAGLGRVDDAIAVMDAAIEREGHRMPPTNIMGNAASALLAHGHEPAARRLFDRAAAEPLPDPGTVLAGAEARPRAMAIDGMLIDADARLFGGDVEGAEAALQRILAVADTDSPGDRDARLQAVAGLALTAAIRGDRATADQHLATLAAWQEALPARWRLPYAHARVAAALGDSDDAVRLLHAAVGAGLRFLNNPNTQIYLAHDPAFHSLRAHPGFRELMRSK
jgi:tetratricopeptide (TPR) repeat protein